MKVVCRIFCAALLMMLSACNAGNREDQVRMIQLRTIASAGLCGSSSIAPYISSVSNRAELEDTWRFIHKGLAGDLPPLPSVDFSREQALVIFMGQKNTAGFGLALASTHAELREGILVLQLQWQEPKLGSMQAHVITSPCIMIGFPRLEYRGVRVIDQAGRVRIGPGIQ